MAATAVGGGVPTLLTPGGLTAVGAAAGEVPIDFITRWVKRRMPEFGGLPPAGAADRVLVVKSKTGSGKSTAMPVHLFRLLRSAGEIAGRKHRGRTVLCTQPRVLTAISIAAEQVGGAPHYPDMVVGKTVGYQTGAISHRPPAGLIFATLDTLLVQLRAMTDAEIADRYAVIIVDEAHERSQPNVDVALMRLKGLIDRMRGFPATPFVVLASATIDTAKYAAYFGIGAANVVEVEGRQYPIADHWPAHGVNDYVRAAAERVAAINATELGDADGRCDILVFMTGVPDMEATETAIHALCRRGDDKGAWAPGTPRRLEVLRVMSEDVNRESQAYLRLGAPPRPGTRRVIIATVVAETGLTIPSLKYVVDCGWGKSKETYPPHRLRGLVQRPAQQSRIMQRRGRAGREFPGVFYPLYTKKTFLALPPQQPPSILVDGIDDILLDLVGEQARLARPKSAADPLAAAGAAFRPAAIDLLDPPPADALAQALEAAALAGVLAAGSGELTTLGARLLRCGTMTLGGARAVAAAYVWRACPLDVMTALAVAGTAGTLQALGADRTKVPAAVAARPRNDAAAAVDLFDGFARAVAAADGSPAEVAAWCAASNVSEAAILEVARHRDALVADWLVAGLNPFWGYEHRLAAAGDGSKGAESRAARVRALTQCLYEGHRALVLAYDPARKEYVAGGAGGALPVPASAVAPPPAPGGAADPPALVFTTGLSLKPPPPGKKGSGLYRVRPHLVVELGEAAGVYHDADYLAPAPDAAPAGAAPAPAAPDAAYIRERFEIYRELVRQPTPHTTAAPAPSAS